VRIAFLAPALLALAACAPEALREPDAPVSRIIDHDAETVRPGADSNLRAIPPGRPPPIENDWSSVHF
jgi:hypothetical protein